MTPTLWRLETPTTAAVDPDQLDQGLRLHIAHTPLTSVLMRIGDQQQAYVGAAGCAGCAYQRCIPGCYVELLRRLLHASVGEHTLRQVPGGLAPRPYCRVVLAWPTQQTEPLAHTLLAPWPEARLVVHWRGAQRQLRCTALLAVGADGPEPAAVLHAAGWRAWSLPQVLAPVFANNRIPQRLPFPRTWSHAPCLLWPASMYTSPTLGRDATGS